MSKRSIAETYLDTETGKAMRSIRAIDIRFVDGDGWHVERSDGTVMIASNAERALAMVLNDDAETARRCGHSLATLITWAGYPYPFTPPVADNPVVVRERHALRRGR